MKKRDYLRVSPSVLDLVKVTFQQKDLTKLSPFIRIRNISVGGIMIQISNAVSGRDRLLPAGCMIENIRLALPRQGICLLSGIVKFTYGSLRGIEFLRNEQEQKRLVRYVHQREIELLGRNHSNWPEEKAFRQNFDERQTGGLYKWLLDEAARQKKKVEDSGGDPAGAREALEKKKILIIDPSSERLDGYSTVFSGEDFEPYADDGLKAWELALKITPDLILIDLCRPGSADMGFQILRKLRGSREMGGLPVFLVTGYDRETVYKALQYGVDDYVIEPENLESVLKRARDFFGPVK